MQISQYIDDGKDVFKSGICEEEEQDSLDILDTFGVQALALIDQRNQQRNKLPSKNMGKLRKLKSGVIIQEISYDGGRCLNDENLWITKERDPGSPQDGSELLKPASFVR